MCMRVWCKGKPSGRRNTWTDSDSVLIQVPFPAGEFRDYFYNFRDSNVDWSSIAFIQLIEGALLQTWPPMSGFYILRWLQLTAARKRMYLMLYMYQGVGAKREPDCLVSAELTERSLQRKAIVCLFSLKGHIQVKRSVLKLIVEVTSYTDWMINPGSTHHWCFHILH